MWKGVRNVVVSQSGGAAAVAILYSFYQADLPAGNGAVRRIRADHRSPHHHTNLVDGARPDPRPHCQLSPRLLPRPLVAVAPGQGAGGPGAGTGPAGSA